MLFLNTIQIVLFVPCILHIHHISHIPQSAHDFFFREYGSLVPFTLPFDNDGHVIIIEDLLSLKLNLHVVTIYIEQARDV